MDIQSLQLFVNVAQMGSFAAVARKHNLDPSSVSRAIGGLEERLEIRLFQRTTRQLELTEAGEIYYSRVAPLLDELELAQDEARRISKTPNGTLRMTATVAFGQVCLLPHIAEFRSRFPQIKLELLFSDSVLNMVTDRIDIACRLAKETHADMVNMRLMKTQYHICASPDYCHSHPPIKQPHDLNNHECLVFDLPDYRSRWNFRDSRKNLFTVDIQSGMVVTGALALRECALAGMGPVLLADWLVKEDIAKGRLVKLLKEYEVSAEDFNTAAWLLYPSRQFLPTKTRVMLDFLKEKFQHKDDELKI